MPEATARLRFSLLMQLRGSLTESRLELLRFVADHEGINARELAVAVDGDCKNVHGDVGKLCELGLLEKRGGGLYAPDDELTTRYALRVAA